MSLSESIGRKKITLAPPFSRSLKNWRYSMYTFIGTNLYLNNLWFIFRLYIINIKKIKNQCYNKKRIFFLVIFLKNEKDSPRCMKKNAILYIDLKNGMIHLVICFSLYLVRPWINLKHNQQSYLAFLNNDFFLNRNENVKWSQSKL